MTRKRFKKLLMGQGYSRNEADYAADLTSFWFDGERIVNGNYYWAWNHFYKPLDLNEIAIIADKVITAMEAPICLDQYNFKEWLKRGLIE